MESTYVCQMTSYDEVCRQLFAAACERGLSTATKVIVPGDGGIGLMEAMQVQFPGCQYILDRPHLKSHWFEVAEALQIEEGLRSRWVQTHMHRIDDGEVHEVITELKNLLECQPNERLEQFIKHLTRFAQAMHYNLFKERGWPRGSGEVESAHRYIPQERLKIPGAWWHPDHVNPMLALRVIRANGWWSDYWAWRADRRGRQTA